jgi:uncharacterized protein (TIGR03663 family)
MLEKYGSKVTSILICLILFWAFFVRLYYMEARPLHSDEGVNFIFMDQLIKSGIYHYDPENYHGPVLYFLTLIPLYFLGVGTSPLPKDLIPNQEYVYRLMPFLMGFGVVVILIPLRRLLKSSGLLTVLALAAISPTMVYYSRDNIHEMYLMFFTAATFVCGYLFYIENKNKYLYLAAMFLALMFTAKETTMVTLVIFCLSALGASFFSTNPISDVGKRFKENMKGAFGFYKKRLFIVFIAITVITAVLMLFFNTKFSKIQNYWYVTLLTKCVAMMTVYLIYQMFFTNFRSRFTSVLLAWGLFYLVIIFFFSSFFTYSEGLSKFFKAFEMWTYQGTEGSKHTKPFIYYLKIMYKIETPILILGTLGVLLSFWKRKPVELFLAFFSIGSVVAFSLIPYKTPWCVQNLILPLLIMSGVFVRYLFELTKYKALKPVYVIVICVILFFNFKLSADVNYLNFDDDSYEIVYVQTNRSAKDIMRDVQELSNIKYDGPDTAILLATEGTLPLNWYFRNLNHVYFTTIPQDIDRYPIIIGNQTQETELDKLLLDRYTKVRYPFNPSTGTFLSMYHKKTDSEKIVPEKFRFDQGTDIANKLGSLKQGLNATVYQNIYFQGRKLDRKVFSDINFRYDTDAEKPYPSPFSIIFEGYLKIPKAGDYYISCTSDDGSFISINGKLVVDNGGIHGELQRGKEVYFSEGYHKIEVKYFDMMGGAIMRLTWKQPGQWSENIIEGKHLFHSE